MVVPDMLTSYSLRLGILMMCNFCTVLLLRVIRYIWSVL
jgi:hypothetical protein